eukprot:562626-Pelagomonas_calceolata.AAC.1
MDAYYPYAALLIKCSKCLSESTLMPLSTIYIMLSHQTPDSNKHGILTALSMCGRGPLSNHQ